MDFRTDWVRSVVVTAGLLTLVAGVGHPQQSGYPVQQTPGSALPPRDNLPAFPKDDKVGIAPFGRPEEKQARLRNDERQKRLVSDADKLLALATQLHDDVGKTDKNILSVEVVRRADEIEKLAHSVKERMKGQ